MWPCRHLRQHGPDGLVGVDHVSAGAGNHRVLRGAGREVEDPVEQSRQLPWQFAGLARFGDDVFEVARRRRMLDVVYRFDPQRPQQQVRRRVEQLDQPPEQRQIDRGGPRKPPGHRFGAGDGEVLREQLAEDHLHDGREQHRQHRADGDTHGGRNTDTAEQLAKAPADQRFGHVADEQAGDGDAELGAGQHERGAPGDRQGTARGGVTGLGTGLEPRPVHGHVGEFLRNEVPGEHRDRDDDEDAENDAQHRQHGSVQGGVTGRSSPVGLGLRGLRLARLIALSGYRVSNGYMNTTNGPAGKVPAGWV